MDKDIEARIKRLEHIEAIRQLKARYFFCCDRKDVQGMRACFADGAVPIDYGAVGRFDDADALAAIFREIGCQPHMIEFHHGLNPMIELTGDQTASGHWSLHYGLINAKDNTVMQLAGYYQDDFRLIDGQWKIAGTTFHASSALGLSIADEQVKVLFSGSALPSA